MMTSDDGLDGLLEPMESAEEMTLERYEQEQQASLDAWSLTPHLLALPLPVDELGAGGGNAGPGGTACQTSHHQECWRVSGGVDYLEVTCYGTLAYDYEETAERLELGRQAALGNGPSSAVDVMAATLVMRGSGYRWANTFFSWVGDYDGITYSLGKRSKSADVPIAKVQISSLKLMRDGHRAAWKQALLTLENLGVRVERTTVFRIDGCVDLPGVPVDGFCEAVFNGQSISRIKSQATAFKRADGSWQGCAVGNRKGVRVAIYDKVHELKEAGVKSEAKRHVMVERRWGVQPDVATRVEFQIRGEWLRRKWQEVRTVDEVFDSLDAIMGYLVTGFFRLVDGEVDRDNNNQKRANVSPLWQQVTEAFTLWLGKAAQPLAKLVKRAPDRERVARRLVSAALSVAAINPGYAVDKVSFLQLALDVLAKSLPPQDDWIGKLQKRWDQWQANGDNAVFTFEDSPDGNASGWSVDLIPNWNEISGPVVVDNWKLCR